MFLMTIRCCCSCTCVSDYMLGVSEGLTHEHPASEVIGERATASGNETHLRLQKNNISEHVKHVSEHPHPQNRLWSLCTLETHQESEDLFHHLLLH